MGINSSWHSGPVASRSIEDALKEIIQKYNSSRKGHPPVFRIPKSTDGPAILGLAKTFANAGRLDLFTGNNTCMNLAEALDILPKIKQLQEPLPA